MCITLFSFLIPWGKYYYLHYTVGKNVDAERLSCIQVFIVKKFQNWDKTREFIQDLECWDEESHIYLDE